MVSWNAETSGADIVAAFPEAVEGKSCTCFSSVWFPNSTKIPCRIYRHTTNRFTVVITGPSAGGIGAQTAIFIAQGKPAELLLLGRSEPKAAPVIEEIKTISPSTTVKFVTIDLASFASIKAAAVEINKTVNKIDVLINNAGIMAIADYTLTADGLESQFGSNYIGHFLLTNFLLPKIEAAGVGARIVSLTSHGHKISEMRFNDYNFENGTTYDSWIAYGQSKTAIILWSTYLAEKLAPKGISAFAVHPGQIVTNLGNHVPVSDYPHLIKLFTDRGR
jgi:NAD(P)-dependent dehydrogenase (short-subunit alcohol dehydrogenase family)